MDKVHLVLWISLLCSDSDTGNNLTVIYDKGTTQAVRLDKELCVG